MIGSLPTLMGAEYTFDFQNMNIERGLFENQENAINRGIQVNQTFGKFTASLSWNDGYYSNRYSWLSGSLTYVNGPHSLSFIGMGNLGQTAFQTLATPVQNNSLMYCRHIHLHEERLDRSAVFSIQQCTYESECRGIARSISLGWRRVGESRLQASLLAGWTRRIHYDDGERS